MTDLIIRARQGGKTTELIRLAAEHDAYIICTDTRRAQQIFRRAASMGLNIRFPDTFANFLAREYHAPGIRGFLFDDLDRMLQGLSPGVRVLAVTWTANSTEPPASALPGALVRQSGRFSRVVSALPEGGCHCRGEAALEARVRPRR